MTPVPSVNNLMYEMDTLSSLVRALSSFGDREAILAFHKDSFEAWSYTHLAAAIERLAAGLIEAGLCSGGRAVIYSPNRPEWILACFALLRVGAVPVPVDSQMARDDLAHVLEDSEARWLLTIRPLAEHLTTLGLHRDRSIVLLDAADDDPRSWRRVSRDPTRALASAQPDDHALLFYTSGVSGPPKGVPLSHRNLLANLRALLEVQVYRPDERLLLPLPLHHVYPFMIGLLAPVAQGLPIVLPHSLTGPQILRALRDGHVTAIVGVPRIYSALYAAIERRVQQKGRVPSAAFHSLLACSSTLLQWFGIRLCLHLFAPLRDHFAPHLRTMVYGGSPLSPDLASKLAGLGWEIAGGYGLTETSPILTFTAPGSRHIDTAGKPLPGVQIRIADPDPHTDQGEIQARGPNVFPGYLHLPNKTAEAFTEDGWFRTGDLGYFDKEGWLHLVGRASSRITLSGGEKVWPERVEELLDSTPSVGESGVLEHQGRLVAVIVPHTATVQPDGIAPLVRLIRGDIEARVQQQPSYWRITDFIVSFDPLPRTRLGKIQRHKLRALFEAGTRSVGTRGFESRPIAIDLMTPEDRQLLEDPIASRTWAWLTRRFSHVRLTPDTNMQLELGLDSLEWMTLTLELRDRIGIDLSEEAVARIGTVRDLLREAADAEQAAGAAVVPAVQLRKPEDLLDREQRHWLRAGGWFIRGFGTALFFIDRLLIRTLFRLDVRGLQHLPAHGPCVLIPNHVSLLDPPAIIAALPPHWLSRTFWGGWTGIMFRTPIMRLVSRATRVLPIDQSSRPLANLALGATVLARGDNLVWFPEGERSRDGTLHPFQPGIGLILTAQPVPVIPILIEGSYEALPRGAWWPHLRPITVLFGEALNPNELAGHLEGAARYRQIATALHDRVEALRHRPRTTTRPHE